MVKNNKKDKPKKKPTKANGGFSTPVQTPKTKRVWF